MRRVTRLRACATAKKRYHPSPKDDYRAIICCSLAFTLGHSESIMLKRIELRFLPSGMMRSCRIIPSCFAPIRRIAARDRSLSSSVVNCTRIDTINSNAWVRRRYFASVLTLDRWADSLNQVCPISSFLFARSIFQKRVLPRTCSVARLTTTKGITVPASRPSNAVAM